jgi:hypothetical protein
MSNVAPQLALMPTDIQHVHRFLHEFGGSYQGTQQLLRGAVITDPKDRHALAALFGTVFKQLTPPDPSPTVHKLPGRVKFEDISFCHPWVVSLRRP